MALVVNTAPAAWWGTPRPLSPLGLSLKTTPKVVIAAVKPKGSSDQSIHGNINIGCIFVLGLYPEDFGPLIVVHLRCYTIYNA